MCCLGQPALHVWPTMGDMATTHLHEFIGTNREELIRRCRAKVVARSSPVKEVKGHYGVPLFLDQLIAELRDGPSKNQEINKTAVKHGHDLLLQGYTVSQVVHDYGDVCQSVTDLAMETDAPIATEDFRTLNRCLDDAIAGAVTEHARGQEVTRDGKSDELQNLIDTAIAGFDVLQTGTVGLSGRTGDVVRRSLIGIRDLIDRPLAPPVKTT